MLGGQAGPVRDIVLLNAGAGLFVAGRAGSVREGITLAEVAIDSGRARSALETLVQVTTEERPA